MDISALRKMRSTNSLSKLTAEFDKIASGGNNRDEDEGFWKLDPDKAGNATATIRFLPTADGDELPWVRIFSHSFKNEANNKWYIEKSLTTLGLDDPVGELNGKLWSTGLDSDKEIARSQKRRLHFYSNIVVINDPKHPENNGKVFKFKYGKKIWDKLMDKIKPTFEDESPVDIFHVFDGADFKLRQKTVDKFPNYDDSAFNSPSELFDGDEEKILEALNSRYKLSELIDPSKFKSYEDLKKRLDLVLGNAPTPVRAPVQEAKAPKEQAAPKEKAQPVQEIEPPSADEIPEINDDDVLSYFDNL